MAGLQSGEGRMMIDSVVWAQYINATNRYTDQSCPWVGLTHGLGLVGLGWVGSRFFSFWWVGFG